MRGSILRLSLGLLAVGAFSTPSQIDLPAAKPLFESGQASKLAPASDTAGSINVVSYNIRWRTGAERDQIASWLKSRRASIIALQEVDRAKERTGNTNNARALAESLGMHYAWTAPPANKQSKEEETGVELLSVYELTDVTPIVLPHKGPGGRWRVALGATIKLGKTNLRVYSVHSETRIAIAQKMDQYQAVLDDLARFPKNMPAIIMGDFNSWEPATISEVRDLFTRAGFTTPIPDREQTFKRDAVIFDVELKLDWIWLRGLATKSFAIDRSIAVSDHFPLDVTAISPG